MSELGGWCVVIAGGVLLGWLIAHDTVSTECDKLGSFYVGSKVYSCQRK